MGKACDARVQSALALAASKYSPWEWHDLPRGYRAGAVYRELRKLDAAAYSQRQKDKTGQGDVEMEGTEAREPYRRAA
jgi:hypothetical protein